MEGLCTTLSYEGLELCGTHSLCNHNDELILALRSRIRQLEEFACRAKAGFTSIKNLMTYSDLEKLEAEVFGSFSCPHEAENTRLREAVEWACRHINFVNGTHQGWERFVTELRRRAGMEG